MPEVDGTGRARAFVRLRSARGRWVVFASVLGSGVVGIDATALSVATPAIGEDFGAPLSSLQWTINAYALTLAGLLLSADRSGTASADADSSSRA